MVRLRSSNQNWIYLITFLNWKKKKIKTIPTYGKQRRIHYGMFITRRLRTNYFNLMQSKSEIEIKNGNLNHIFVLTTFDKKNNLKLIVMEDRNEHVCHTFIKIVLVFNLRHFFSFQKTKFISIY